MKDKRKNNKIVDKSATNHLHEPGGLLTFDKTKVIVFVDEMRDIIEMRLRQRKHYMCRINNHLSHSRLVSH